METLTADSLYICLTAGFDGKPMLFVPMAKFLVAQHLNFAATQPFTGELFYCDKSF